MSSDAIWPWSTPVLPVHAATYRRGSKAAGTAGDEGAEPAEGGRSGSGSGGTASGGGGGMAQKEQRAVLQAFRDGEFNTLVATCIGEEGLDIPEVRRGAAWAAWGAWAWRVWRVDLVAWAVL